MAETTYTDLELLYAATARCKCGAGLAYPLDHEAARKLRAWVCSAVLKGEASAVSEKWPGGVTPANANEAPHDRYDFAFWKIREETSINNAGSFTTRPAGTVARTIGHARCPRCEHEWQSEPYDAPRYPAHHWFGGPCRQCGYAVAAAGSWSSDEGDPIRHTYQDVALENPETGND